MIKTLKNGTVMFAGFFAIIFATFLSFAVFLAVTIIPVAKTHSNYYILTDKEEQTESDPSLGELLDTKTELFFVGDKYYTKETILDSEPVKSELSDYVICDGRIYFDITKAEFAQFSEEDRGLLPSYKISGDKLITEDGVYVNKSNHTMFLVGLIGLGVSLVLVIIALTMIYSYNKQMRAVRKEVSSGKVKANLIDKIKSLPQVVKMLSAGAVAVCLLVFGVLLAGNIFPKHLNSYVEYSFEQTSDENTSFGFKSIGDIYKFYKTVDGITTKVEPDIKTTYTFKGKTMKVKTETVSNVFYIETTYLIKSVGKDLEKRFGSEDEGTILSLGKSYYNDTRIFFGMTEEDYNSYINSLLAIPEGVTVFNSSDPNTNAYYYDSETGDKVEYVSLNQISYKLSMKEMKTSGNDFRTYGAYGEHYYLISAVGAVLVILGFCCLIFTLTLSKGFLKNLKKGSGNGEAQAAIETGTSTTTTDTTTTTEETTLSATTEETKSDAVATEETKPSEDTTAGSEKETTAESAETTPAKVATTAKGRPKKTTSGAKKAAKPETETAEAGSGETKSTVEETKPKRSRSKKSDEQ